MNSGTVDLIATDPPFNKGRDFRATPDSLADGASFQDRWSWEEDVREEWVDLIRDDRPAVWEVIDAAKASFGADMSAFLCFMGVRIMEMRRVLKDTGSIYLHCDPTASHYLKMMMDAVFGSGNFRNEIVWRIGWVSGYKTQKKGFIRNHDVLLYYVKGPGFTFNKFFLPYPPGYVRRDGKPPSGKGIPLEDTWNCNAADVLDSIMIKSFSKEKTGYPTQKPLALYERIIQASSKEGDVVLDPFCGCATTLIAAERLGRNWVGVDIWDEAHEIVWDRLLGEGLAVKGARKKGQGLLGEKDISCETVAPVRTDAGDEAVPLLKTVEKIDEPKGERRTRKQMMEFLIGRHGCRCFGCDRVFDDPDYLDLDHNTPRADGGLNHISNRILLCGPCNRRKGHTLTLSGLRKRNGELGKMTQRTRDNRLPK